MNDSVEVSVICLAYNHEKYIRETLEGFIKQKTSFRYEVIVHDDASTDRTQNIICEYCSKYPDVFVPILQKENQYSSGKHITTSIIIPKAKGRYIAFCEGDDYWTDPHKLQMQYDILEKNSNCSLCVHAFEIISESGEKLKKCISQIHSGILPRELVMSYSGGKFPQTATFFLRKEVFSLVKELAGECPVGDVNMKFCALVFGDVYYINKPMSVWRKQSIGSWSSRMKNNNEFKKKHSERILRYYYLIRDYLPLSDFVAWNHAKAFRELDFYALKLPLSSIRKMDFWKVLPLGFRLKYIVRNKCGVLGKCLVYIKSNIDKVISKGIAK